MRWHGILCCKLTLIFLLAIPFSAILALGASPCCPISNLRGLGQCRVFCGGARCKYCDATGLKCGDDANLLRGLYSSRITDSLVAMSRPTKRTIDDFALIEQLKMCVCVCVYLVSFPLPPPSYARRLSPPFLRCMASWGLCHRARLSNFADQFRQPPTTNHHYQLPTTNHQPPAINCDQLVTTNLQSPATNIQPKLTTASHIDERVGITSVFNLQQIGEHATCGAGNLPCGFSYDPEEFMRQDSAFGCPILFAPRGFTIPLPTSHGGLCWRIPNSCGTHGKLSCLGLGYRLGGNHVRCYLPPLGFRWPNPVPLRPGTVQVFNFGWPDFGVPSFGSMMDMVKVMCASLKDGGKAAVHCHAGLGRTGMLLACYLM